MKSQTIDKVDKVDKPEAAGPFVDFVEFVDEGRGSIGGSLFSIPNTGTKRRCIASEIEIFNRGY